jgi:hypothetical protein
MSEDQDLDINGRLDVMMSALNDDKTQDTEANAPDPAAIGETEPQTDEAIGEDQVKTSEKDKAEPSVKAIEPPISWPSDDKEAFKSLPTWAQERIINRENEREAHFAERSRTIATRERDLQDVQVRTNEAQSKYSAELQRLNQLATQLLPAKFADIKGEADYLRVKVEDPARASEYEAFVQILRSSAQQEAQVQQQRFKEQLDNEYSALSEKFPEFKDNAKANSILGEVRKAAVDYYGFTPQEVSVIADHRHVPIIRDAMAWRNYQATLKAAAGKKTPLQQPTANLRSSGVSSPSVASEQTKKILNRVRSSNNVDEQATLIASLFR